MIKKIENITHVFVLSFNILKRTIKTHLTFLITQKNLIGWIKLEPICFYLILGQPAQNVPKV